MVTCRSECRTCLVAAAIGFTPGASGAEFDSDHLSTWRLEIANDAVFDSDDQFTNGLSVHLHSRTFRNLEEVSGTPAFGKGLARWFLPEAAGLHYREGWVFGQDIQTPNEISREELILDDVPYVGMLGWANSFIAFNDRRLTGFQMLFGLVGPESGGETVQSALHKISGSQDPKGWDNQLDTEPVLNLYFSEKRKIWRGSAFDAALAYDAALGNFFTFGQAGLEMRFGRMPCGFTFIPDPLGRNMDYDGTRHSGAADFFYATAVIRGTGFLHALPREGNTFRDDNPWTESNTVDMEDIVGQAIVGLHYERPRWGIHLNYWLSTDTVDSDAQSGFSDPENNFGVVMLEWRSY